MVNETRFLKHDKEDDAVQRSIFRPESVFFYARAVQGVYLVERESDVSAIAAVFTSNAIALNYVKRYGMYTATFEA